MTTFETPIDPIPRDRFGRPLVVPPGGGKPVPYTRCTTYVGVLEDRYGLEKWSQRMVALGLASRPDLLLAVSAARDDKKRLDEITDAAKEAAAANAAATTGTALHSLTERLDRGLPLGVIPGEYQADLDAYRVATAPLESCSIEAFTVVDSLKIGGTPDRVVKYGGRYYIADVKTGSIAYGLGKIAMQLAVYAHGIPYDHSTGERLTPFPVSKDRAIVIHLPAGTGTCELVWIDIARGWEKIDLARQVREWRQVRDLATPFGIPPLTEATVPPDSSDLDNAIASAPTVDALTALWRTNAKQWTDAQTELAAARKALLAGRLVPQ